MFTHTAFHTDSQSVEGMDKSLRILCIVAPQLLEYVIFIDSQHLVDVSDVQLLLNTIQQILDVISVHFACTGALYCIFSASTGTIPLLGFFL